MGWLACFFRAYRKTGKGLSLSLRGFNVYLYPAGSLRVSGLVVGVVPGFRYSVTAFGPILFFFFDSLRSLSYFLSYEGGWREGMGMGEFSFALTRFLPPLPHVKTGE